MIWHSTFSYKILHICMDLFLGSSLLLYLYRYFCTRAIESIYYSFFMHIFISGRTIPMPMFPHPHYFMSLFTFLPSEGHLNWLNQFWKLNLSRLFTTFVKILYEIKFWSSKAEIYTDMNSANGHRKLKSEAWAWCVPERVRKSQIWILNWKLDRNKDLNKAWLWGLLK